MSAAEHGWIMIDGISSPVTYRVEPHPTTGYLQVVLARPVGVDARSGDIWTLRQRDGTPISLAVIRVQGDEVTMLRWDGMLG